LPGKGNRRPRLEHRHRRGFPRRDKPGRQRPRQDIPAFLAPFPAGPRGRGIRIRDEQAAGRGQDRGERELTLNRSLHRPEGEIMKRRRARRANGAVVLAAALTLIGAGAAAGCSSISNSSSTGTSTGGTGATTPAGAASSSSAGAATVDTSQCGSKPGVKATGTPIALGAIATNQPG